MHSKLAALDSFLAVLLLALIAGCGSSETVNDDSDSSSLPESAPSAAAAEELDPLARLDPESPGMQEQAPDQFRVKFETTKGDVIIQVHRAWSPNGADRFYNLVRNGFYDDCRIFRVVKGFMAQMGIHADPKVSALYNAASIPDDPVVESNTRGRVTFAKTQFPNSRTTQIYINYVDNSGLDRQGFAPFGEVVSGMEVVDEFYGGYAGEPSQYQGQIKQQGNPFLDQRYPNLDSIVKATIVEG